MGTLVLAGLFFAAASFFLLTVTEKRIETATDFMVVQKTGQQDFYTMFKSSEYLGKVLGESIYSEKFINTVIETGKVNSEFLPFDKQDRLKEWRQMVMVAKNIELGMLRVSVKSDSEREATRVMQGIEQVLIEKNALFRGGDEGSVEIRVLSGPIVSRNPDFSEIALVVLVGFVSGVMLATLYLLIKSGRRTGYAGLAISRDMLPNEG